MGTDARATPKWRLALNAVAWLLVSCATASFTSVAHAQETVGDVPADSLRNDGAGLRAQPQLSPPQPSTPDAPFTGALQQLPDLTKRENFSAAMQIIILLTVLSLAPAILIMMTSFTRLIIVLSLLRQALGTQQLPPNQILIGLSMFMTFLVMAPTWQRVNNEALQPYMRGEMSQQQALGRAVVPVREFMIRQLEASGNESHIDLFAQYNEANPAPQVWEDVSTITLIPAFILSELKTAFLMGFKIYLPFLIVDIVISSMLISMGMMMLPPVLISLPFKLLLFVLVDGWRLIAGSLMGSFV
jgi:flagellar biosynthetic protein FliP